jgi:pyruvate/2-oxoglutarate/acetoin dehydrogenase E1 component
MDPLYQKPPVCWTQVALAVNFCQLCLLEIVNGAGKLRYMSDGRFEFPVVVMAMTGGGWTVGARHNLNLEACFVHSPDLKVVMLSTPADFKGPLKSAIRDDNPVLFFTDMTLGYVDGEHFAILHDHRTDLRHHG